jgi:hypothetical protein
MSLRGAVFAPKQSPVGHNIPLNRRLLQPYRASQGHFDGVLANCTVAIDVKKMNFTYRPFDYAEERSAQGLRIKRDGRALRGHLFFCLISACL